MRLLQKWEVNVSRQCYREICNLDKHNCYDLNNNHSINIFLIINVIFFQSNFFYTLLITSGNEKAYLPFKVNM